MNFQFGSRSYSRKSAGVLLLVGVLAGVTVGGGVGVIAASSTKTVTVCANKKTNVLRYAKNGKCVKKKETKVLLNQTGAPGTNGTNGTNGAKGDTGPAGSSSPTGFTARSVCGSDGTTLCAVGVRGPGGGTIFYVDSTNEIPGYDYLEVAPERSPLVVTWSTSTAKCGLNALVDCQISYLSNAGTALGYIGIGWGQAATAAIVARHDAGKVPKTAYAAGVADTYTTATASDWFLPSRDELNEVCKYARNTRQAAGADVVCSGGTLRIGFVVASYHSSTEAATDESWSQRFDIGDQSGGIKWGIASVLPIRAF